MPSYTPGLNVTLPEGTYDFVVVDADDKQSQSSGNEMIELQLLVKGEDGQEIRIFDNLVFAEKAFWKIDKFRVCTGDKLVKGQSVEFDATDCLDRTGKCFVVVDKFEGRERNKVKENIDPASEKPPPKKEEPQKPVIQPVIQKPVSRKPGVQKQAVTPEPAVPVVDDDDELPLH